MRLALSSAALALAILIGSPAFADDAATPPAASAPADAAPSEAAAPSDANAGTTPIPGDGVYKAFHGKDGIDRVTHTLVGLYKTDPRIKDIFAATDTDRLSKLLAEQVCYIVGGPCHYSGRDMKTAHADMGVQTADFDALVEDLQKAMDAEHVPFWAQNKLLAKLAPMERMVVTR
jgi:hemoglobin